MAGAVARESSRFAGQWLGGPRVEMRHNEMFNAAFYDRHVEAVKRSTPGQWTFTAGD